MTAATAMAVGGTVTGGFNDKKCQGQQSGDGGGGLGGDPHVGTVHDAAVQLLEGVAAKSEALVIPLVVARCVLLPSTFWMGRWQRRRSGQLGQALLARHMSTLRRSQEGGCPTRGWP